MDILNEIEKQIESIKKVDNSSYLDSIFAHISRAEHYYKEGRSDSHFFNDVIYRSNQAYEGALKESYKILADKTDDEVIKKNPNEIEKFFESNNIFKDRVLQLFKNYRQEWRNKSTHDHKLLFDDNEAFIALTSVTSFVHLLLKQINEKVTYISLQKKLQEEKKLTAKAKAIVKSTGTPIEKLIDIIKEFSAQNSNYIASNADNIREGDIISLLQAFIESVDTNIKLEREPRFEVRSGSYIGPDFLLTIDKQRVLLELKSTRTVYDFHQALNQITKYLEITDYCYGVIFLVNVKEANSEVKTRSFKRMVSEREVDITIVYS